MKRDYYVSIKKMMKCLGKMIILNMKKMKLINKFMMKCIKKCNKRCNKTCKNIIMIKRENISNQFKVKMMNGKLIVRMRNKNDSKFLFCLYYCIISHQNCHVLQLNQFLLWLFYPLFRDCLSIL